MVPYRKSRLQLSICVGLAALMLAACSQVLTRGLASQQTETLRHMVILYTNDEHGWMDPYQDSGGSAGMAHKWRQQEGWSQDGSFLILSGGDMWTGHALSTVWEGESATSVMNTMGYDAAAIGNHDFDFGLDALRERADQAEFPFLSANLREKATGETPGFALPYFLTEINGIQVGLIGLTTTETKVDTHPSHVAGFDFLPYAEVLPDVAASAHGDGAELLLIIGHVCGNETRSLAPLAAELGILFIGGGHCHQEINEELNGVQLVESGFFNRGYTRIDILYDTENNSLVDMKTTFVLNKAGPEDEEIASLIESWREQTDDATWETIGYAESGIDRKSAEMAALILDPWLDAWSGADAALASSRYVQQDLFQGDITTGVIIGLLSTTNELVEVDITGAQLIETIEAHRPLMAGIVAGESGYRFSDGRVVDPDWMYRILVPEALYEGGDYFEFFKFDPDPTFTGIDWRQPTLDWIRSVGSNRGQPINEFLSD